MSQLPVPQHIAIIMDGNGRWAARRGLSRSEGHQAGAEPLRALLTAARKAGVKYLTLYAFSTENWGRPEEEVRGLFELLSKYLKSELDELLATGVRLMAIGELEDLPPLAAEALRSALEASADNRGLTLTLALSYGSRAELTRAARLLAAEAAAGRLDPRKIDEQALEDRLWTAGQPAPDLLIRTGGDMRLSNFLLWQCAYAEFYFTPTLWPDFGPEDFEAALASYRRRERRFGLAESPGLPTAAAD
ncbi:MAG: di-trans,poly-cis-decaprenylcistransferase [Candidatus Adiutrix sp.]|jgi:undecaprenyl diphosphate synthase|nr:di-trans,poly-cis-decaprenylcistransferase [Candidatus Adiutrix sp.]